MLLVLHSFKISDAVKIKLLIMPKRKDRKSPRLKEYDYSNGGYYFVTICTHNMRSWLGIVSDEKMHLNKFGEIVKDCWLDLPKHYKNCELDEFIIVPNHFHGIIIIDNSLLIPKYSRRGGSEILPYNDKHIKKYSMTEIVRGFKSFSSRRINESAVNSKFKWQRSFYERIIRNEIEYYKIKKYIVYNPLKWDLDKNSPGNIEF